MSQNFDNSLNSDESSVTFRGPANWFSFTVPSSLQLEQTEAFIEIKPVAAATSAVPPSTAFAEDLQSTKKATQADWTLTLYSAWVDAGEPQTRASSINAASLFPKVISSAGGQPLDLPGVCKTWAGTSREAAAGPWWKKLLAKRSTYEWRLWVVEYCDIIIVASLQSKAGSILNQPTVKACAEVLNSILFAEDLAKPPILFRQEVIEIARTHFPLLTTVPVGSFGIEVSGSEVNLSNFYRSYIQSPKRIKEIVLPGLVTIVRLQELSPEQLMPSLDEVVDRVMPMLYPESEGESTMKDFVGIKWVGGLTVMFVLDEDDSYRFVHKSMLEKWDINAEQLQHLAMKNLQLFADDNPLEVSLVGSDNDAQMLVPVNPSPYNSVRLLGEQLHGRLRQVLGAELVVGVPNRDFFVAVSLNHPELIAQIQERVVQDYQAMHHPLTSRLLVISADGVSEYCES